MAQQFNKIEAKNLKARQMNGPTSAGRMRTKNSTDGKPVVVLPKRKLRPHTAIISKAQLEFLKKSSTVSTVDDEIALLEKEKAKNLILAKESAERKLAMQEYDNAIRMANKSNKKTDKEEEQGKILDQVALQRAEEEQEIKLANTIILAAKCSAIRNAQIAEKQEIAKRIRQRDNYLDQIMEENRIKAVKAENEHADHKRNIKLKQAADIQKQLNEKQRQREIEAYKIQQEAEIMATVNEENKKFEEIEVIRKQDKMNKLRSDQKKMLEMSVHNKQIIFEQDEIANMKVNEYMKLRDKRENKLKLEKLLAKQKAEMQQEVIVSNYKKTTGLRKNQIELAFQYEYEEKEREFRKKEKEAAIRRKQIAKETADARMQQIKAMRDRKVQEILKDEEIFKISCEQLKKEKEREQEKNKQKANNQATYRAEIIRQMNEAEYKRRASIQENKNDLLNYKTEEAKREQTISTITESKIQRLRDAKIPDDIINIVERKLKDIK